MRSPHGAKRNAGRTSRPGLRRRSGAGFIRTTKAIRTDSCACARQRCAQSRAARPRFASPCGDRVRSKFVGRTVLARRGDARRSSRADAAGRARPHRNGDQFTLFGRTLRRVLRITSSVSDSHRDCATGAVADSGLKAHSANVKSDHTNRNAAPGSARKPPATRATDDGTRDEFQSVVDILSGPGLRLVERTGHALDLPVRAPRSVPP